LSETKVEPKMKATTVGKLKCPKCGYLNWAVVGRGNPPIFQCGKCECWFQEKEWQIVEMEVDAFKCPNCGALVADSEENYSIGVWAGPEPVLVCPECLTIIRGFLHHEDPRGASIMIKVDEEGGYMHVLHKGCPKAEGGIGYMRLKRLCVDAETEGWLKNHGYRGRPGSRVVLVYVCEQCGTQQVVKASLEDTFRSNTYKSGWWNP